MLRDCTADRLAVQSRSIPVGLLANLLARQTDGAAVELPPEQTVIPTLWRANANFENGKLFLHRSLPLARASVSEISPPGGHFVTSQKDAENETNCPAYPSSSP